MEKSNHAIVQTFLRMAGSWWSCVRLQSSAVIAGFIGKPNSCWTDPHPRGMLRKRHK
jgi:hypothetical protein